MKYWQIKGENLFYNFLFFLILATSVKSFHSIRIKMVDNNIPSQTLYLVVIFYFQTSVIYYLQKGFVT